MAFWDKGCPSLPLAVKVSNGKVAHSILATISAHVFTIWAHTSLNQLYTPSAVNMAARMEQNSQPSCIRVTKDFHDIVGDAEKGWKQKEVIPLKNMGEMETYLLDPLEIRIGEIIDNHQACPQLG